ncbi:hypothetical protein CY34DRAFT_109090 [Suillus luteus UH-Slu-Lm8-n1]|uniref:Unplaced genomic scaffold CY34scaffold_320, whole genome shotgun sequence n=1 Tax=Suillus luteus UH-Slu-Lm8-n1 TaxID=930992 RepID=A0A0D0B051_9AGAM|nr:hypothetical protein CY34DRAFT_109090 [Suillus luteus UH-Slu-Lm8-n1]
MDSCSSIISDWSIMQLEWLNDQADLYVSAFEDDDLSFFSTMNKLFLDLWPVHQMLWPSKPEYQCLTNSEQQHIYDAEDWLKIHIRSFFKEHYPQPGTSMLDTCISKWSSDQLEWLNNYKSAFVSAHRHNELRLFWPSILENFIKLWPICQLLWPIKPTWQILSKVECHCILNAEGEIALNIMFFFERLLTLCLL